MERPQPKAAGAVHVSQDDVRRLCEFLYRRTGMLFADSKRYYIDRRLAERIAATGSRRSNPISPCCAPDAEHEIEHLVNAFTVNETYFYREDHQLRCMTVESARTRSSCRASIRASRSASGRSHARPGRSPIRSPSG